ncbi:MAG: hypothetical protein JRD89_13725 [Deltaproteobacteria bacterium]|nr:hypothetical protein [Deltaproteobacteria bacterium]
MPVTEWTEEMLRDYGKDNGFDPDKGLLKDIPIEEVTTDMVIITECFHELREAVCVLNSDPDFDYDMCHHAMFRAANILMAFPRPDGDHNYMAMTPATSVYLFGEDDEYMDPELRL